MQTPSRSGPRPRRHRPSREAAGPKPPDPSGPRPPRRSRPAEPANRAATCPTPDRPALRTIADSLRPPGEVEQRHDAKTLSHQAIHVVLPLHADIGDLGGLVATGE